MSILDSTVLRTSSRSARLVVTTFGLLALGGASLRIQAQGPPPAAAQTTRDVNVTARADGKGNIEMTPRTTPNVTFDVASIKRNLVVEKERLALPPTALMVPGRAQTLRGGVVIGRGMTVKEMIRDAYGYRNRAKGDIGGGPGWLDTERYDVQARASHEFPLSSSMGLPPDAEAALRALLAERMHLKLRVESPLRPVYELVFLRADHRLGPNLKPSKGGCIPFFRREPYGAGLLIEQPKEGDPPRLRPCPLMIGPGMMGLENSTMEDWAQFLQLAPQLDRTVIDRTGLKGGFDVMIKTDETPRPTDPLPAIQPLLESQLGLTLRDAQAPVEILVIESIDHPSEN